MATDLLSCDAQRTLGSMDSAAWELGPKKLVKDGRETWNKFTGGGGGMRQALH